MAKKKHNLIGLGRKVTYEGRELTIVKLRGDLVFLFDGNRQIAVTKKENIGHKSKG